MFLRFLSTRARAIAPNEQGQIAWGFVVLILFIFMIFGVAFDAGVWFFDHRTAQNQAEAAALAAVIELPSADDTAARAVAHNYLERNGVVWSAEACDGIDPVSFEDRTGDGEYDLVRVCLSRESGVLFSAVSNITNVQISASAAALIGRANISEVMPWAIVPPDPDCTSVDTCQSVDYDGDGAFTSEGECEGPFSECPWGLNKDKLYLFKSGGGGNTGIIDACGNGAVGYRECIEGESATGFRLGEGETVVTGLQGGNLGVNTDNALNVRYAQEAADGYVCDVHSTPNPVTGHDEDGRDEAYIMFGEAPVAEYCRERLVMIPILASLPDTGGGSTELTVLGVAVFGIAAWNHDNNQSTYGNDSNSSTGGAAVAGECSSDTPADPGYECGMVWGYLMEGLQPPDYLLQKITNSDNPFAPLLIALVE